MSPAAGQPSGRIVAELGRPETPEEAAARQAESSRRYRTSKTFPNLVWALLVCLGVVLLIVLLVPRDDAPVARDLDVALGTVLTGLGRSVDRVARVRAFLVPRSLFIGRRIDPALLTS